MPTRSRQATPGCIWNDDLNSAQNEGIGRNQNTIRNGRRCSAAAAYLRPALERDNLTIETDALATRVLIEGNRAVGVEYPQGRQTRSLPAPIARCCWPAASSTRRSC